MKGGVVIDFDTYKRSRKILTLTKPCKRPWHKAKYVVDEWCKRCGCYVTTVWHPSMKKPRYRG